MIIVNNVRFCYYKKYHPQTLLEECKYEITKKEMKNLISDAFDSSSKSDSEPVGESDESGDDEADK